MKHFQNFPEWLEHERQRRRRATIIQLWVLIVLITAIAVIFFLGTIPR